MGFEKWSRAANAVFLLQMVLSWTESQAQRIGKYTSRSL